MTPSPDQDWDPGAYHRFRGLRLRPALDLFHAVPDVPEGPLIDLGCGSGAVGPLLTTLGRPVIGVDRSPAMLREAERTGVYTTLIEADVADWLPDDPPALIYSNAVFQWLGDHAGLLPRLASALVPGGTLAVQVPGQDSAPSHALWRELAGRYARDDIAAETGSSILSPVDYVNILAPFGAVSVWETQYYQRVEPAPLGHPVRHFTQSTYARPFLASVAEADQRAMITAYDQEIAAHYPPDSDGSVLFPFRRVFFTLTRTS